MDGFEKGKRLVQHEDSHKRLFGLLTLVEFIETAKQNPSFEDEHKEQVRECVDIFIALLDDTPTIHEMANNAIQTSVELIPESFANAVRHYIFDGENDDHADMLIRRLGWPTGIDKAVDLLVEIMDRELADAQEIIKVLGKTGNKRAVPTILEFLAKIDKTHEEMRGTMEWKDLEVGGISVIEMMKTDELVTVLDALAEIADPETMPVLLGYVEYPDVKVHNAAIHALYEIECCSATLDYEDIKGRIVNFVKKSGNTEQAKRTASESLNLVCSIVSETKGKIGMPGEVLPDKPKPPGGRTFRRREIAK